VIVAGETPPKNHTENKTLLEAVFMASPFHVAWLKSVRNPIGEIIDFSFLMSNFTPDTTRDVRGLGILEVYAGGGDGREVFEGC